MARTTFRKVEMTKPGAKNRFKVIYDDFVRWTNDRPDDRRGPITGPTKRMRMYKLFSKPSTRSGLKALWDAIASGEGFEAAVQGIYNIMGPKNGTRALRHIRDYEKKVLDDGKEDMSDEEKAVREKVIEGLDEAKKILRKKLNPMEKYQKKANWVTADEMESICSSCAQKMRDRGIRAVDVSVLWSNRQREGEREMKRSSADVMVANELVSIAKLISAAEVEAAKWESLPKGWDESSLKSFWNSLTGDRKHRVTKCISEMSGKVTDPGAFCGGLESRLGLR